MQLKNDHIECFRKKLLRWFKENKRNFPWRNTGDAFRILISEIMLRRTRADQVKPVYEDFIHAYPDVRALVQAEPDDIRKAMSSLGLGWRIENVVKLARDLEEISNGKIPKTEEGLKSLTGVGDYVSAAVLCFAFKKPVPLIDTNIVRVLGRVFGLNTSGEARRRREIREAAKACVDIERPKEYHYALLDFAAKICTPRKPLCEICPFSGPPECEYYKRIAATR